MRDSRTGIVLVLTAVEVLILGLIINALGLRGGFSAQAAGFHSISFAAKPVAPMDLGRSPHVVVADPDSHVTLSASSDGLVHITDLTEVRGAVFASKQIAQLNVAKTGPDSVSITRPSSGSSGVFSLGIFSQHIEVQVPPQAHVEVTSASGSDASDLTAGVTIHSIDGRITLNRVTGPVDVKSNDGSIHLSDIDAPDIKAITDDGRIVLSSVRADTIEAHTADGRIVADSLRVGGGRLETQDGQVRIDLRDPDLTVAAHTADGHIRLNGTTQSHDDGDASSGTFRLGNGSGALDVSTRDGSITITSNNGAQ
jgi:hypothetical protein